MGQVVRELYSLSKQYKAQMNIGIQINKNKKITNICIVSICLSE